ncbi:polysaccharide biosynthesis C-terminal domain-containing protein [Shimazuella sp. AN120528]|uniref:MATE family efflux transporter n=1 Tax=Shimazuella soli TaxID=1892854 RepID=UPI001F0F8898|nr:MATE family efflux transporter [Shimazuella soli]MCH5584791.1 polysaccharide biosynthesis C-terminal domain-containing protein [Shimazuella soli]
MYWKLLKKIKHQLWKTFTERFLDLLVFYSNSFLVSNKLGLGAVAAVGVSNMILLTFGILISSLTSVTNTKVGKSIGQEQITGSTHSQKGVYIVQGFYLVGSLSLLLSFIALIFAPQMLAISGANHATVAQGTPYLRILGSLYLFESLRKLCADALQGMNDFESPLKAGAWMNGCHFVLALGVVLFTDLGIVGVAWATAVSQAVGLLLLVRRLKQQAFQTEVPWKLEWTMLKDMFILSKFSMAQGIFTRVSMIAYGMALLSVSPEAYASMIIQDGFLSITYMVQDAFVLVMTTAISVRYGERTALHSNLHGIQQDHSQKQGKVRALVEKDKELVRTVTGFLGLTCLFTGALVVLQYLAWSWIILLYTNDPITIQVSHKFSLAAVFWLVPFTCYFVFYKGALASVEDRKGSQNSNIIAASLWIASLWVVRNWGLDAVLISKVLFETLRGLLIMARFYSMRWSRCPSKDCALSQ